MSTNISYCDETMSPVCGCSPASEGCRNAVGGCFAEAVANRGMCEQHKGLTDEQGRWNGKVRLVPKALEKPLRWGPIKTCLCCDWESGRSWCPTHVAEGARTTRNRIVLSPSMGDGLHDKVPNEFIAAWFGAMAAASNATFLFLTKRIERFLPWVAPGGWLGSHCQAEDGIQPLNVLGHYARKFDVPVGGQGMGPVGTTWPPPNVVICTTVENQKRADKRLPELAKIAAHGWRTGISVEPMLGPVDLEWPKTSFPGGPLYCCDGYECGCQGMPTVPPLMWPAEFVAVGSETGPGARPCEEAWIRSVVEQCKRHNVRVHVKQLTGHRDMSTWPEDLRVREMIR